MNQLGSYGGTQGVFNWGSQPGGGGPIKGPMGVGTPGQQGGFNAGQTNYIQNQGKLPGQLAGLNPNAAQMNFIQNQGYLPGGLGTAAQQKQFGGYYQKPPMQAQFGPYGEQSQQWNPYTDAYNHLFG